VRFLIASAVFPPAFGYGGIPHIVFGLAEAFLSLGHACQVISTNANGKSNLPIPLNKSIDYHGVPVIYTRRLGHNTYFFAPNFHRHLMRLAPDVDLVLVFGGWGYINLAARLTFPRLSVPYVLSPQGLFDPYAFHHKSYKKYPYWLLVERQNYRRAAGIVVMSEMEAAQVSKFVTGIPMRVIPNGINLQHFYPAPGKDDLKLFFPQIGERPFILFLSRLHPKKGLDLLLPAFARVLADCRSKNATLPCLVVAGEGELNYEQELRKLIDNLEVANYVLFTGLVTDTEKLALLHHCEYLVLPSRGEGMPMAVLEALACEKPVILTSGCYLPEVTGAEAGLEVGLDQKELAKAMIQLWEEPDLRQEMGKRALDLIKDRFTWEQVATETVTFCNQLLNKPQENTNARKLSS
jgi:glycosyltransferase involved in cell wall biosynthesis